MLKFIVDGKAGIVELNLPTSLEEISNDYLKQVTEEIKLADDYSLVAVCYREKIANIILSSVKKNNITTACVPVFVKSGNTDSEYIKSIATGDKLVLSGSDIAMGFHATTPKNKITINHIVDICATDKTSYQRAAMLSDYCYFVEFKIVPNCSIHGHYSTNDLSSPFINPYVTSSTEGTNKA